MHLEAIDNDLWYVMENGVPSVSPSLNATGVKRFRQLDSQAKNIICGHLSKGQYGRVSALETAKLICDRLSKVNEGVSTQRDSRVDVLLLRFEFLESLHVSSVDGRSDRGNAIFHNIPEIVVNCLKMHSHLILPVGVVRPIEGRTPSRDLDHTCGRHN